MQRLTAKQLQFVDRLIEGDSAAAAAKAVGASDRVGQRWATLPLIQAELRQRTGNRMATVSRCLIKSSRDCVETLTAVAIDPEISPAVRVSAAKTILEFGYKAYELMSLEDRLTTIERQLSEQNQSAIE